MRRHVSVPQGDRGPVEVQSEGRVVLPQARDEAGGQKGGHLQVLVSKEEWGNRGVQPEMSPIPNTHTDPEREVDAEHDIWRNSIYYHYMHYMILR